MVSLNDKTVVRAGYDANIEQIFKRNKSEPISRAGIEEYKCFRCKLLLRQPQQFSCCGRRCCRVCIDGLRRWVKINYKNCPRKWELRAAHEIKCMHWDWSHITPGIWVSNFLQRQEVTTSQEVVDWTLNPAVWLLCGYSLALLLEWFIYCQALPLFN